MKIQNLKIVFINVAVIYLVNNLNCFDASKMNNILSDHLTTTHAHDAMIKFIKEVFCGKMLYFCRTHHIYVEQSLSTSFGDEMIKAISVCAKGDSKTLRWLIENIEF